MGKAPPEAPLRQRVAEHEGAPRRARGVEVDQVHRAPRPHHRRLDGAQQLEAAPLSSASRATAPGERSASTRPSLHAG
ncbi:MAG: hypothetical protein IPF99_37720 [Deltaproteobacteria bacterium]|nr:hypothetical protein [Deltaproteobacteria bacterium]